MSGSVFILIDIFTAFGSTPTGVVTHGTQSNIQMNLCTQQLPSLLGRINIKQYTVESKRHTNRMEYIEDMRISYLNDKDYNGHQRCICTSYKRYASRTQIYIFRYIINNIYVLFSSQCRPFPFGEVNY